MSPGTRFAASLVKATQRPSPEIAGLYESPFASAPPVATLARTVWPVWVSCTKTSWRRLASAATRFEARLSNAIQRPVLETEGACEKSSPCGSPPGEGWLTRVVLVTASVTAAPPGWVGGPALARAPRDRAWALPSLASAAIAATASATSASHPRAAPVRRTSREPRTPRILRTIFAPPGSPLGRPYRRPRRPAAAAMRSFDGRRGARVPRFRVGRAAVDGSVEVVPLRPSTNAEDGGKVLCGPGGRRWCRSRRPCPSGTRAAPLPAPGGAAAREQDRGPAAGGRAAEGAPSRAHGRVAGERDRGARGPRWQSARESRIACSRRGGSGGGLRELGPARRGRWPRPPRARPRVRREPDERARGDVHALAPRSRSERLQARFERASRASAPPVRSPRAAACAAACARRGRAAPPWRAACARA